MTTYRIIRRAFSQYAVVDTFEGTWVEAMNHAMAVEAEKQDGEYSIRRPGEPLRSEPSSSYQSEMDWI